MSNQIASESNGRLDGNGEDHLEGDEENDDHNTSRILDSRRSKKRKSDLFGFEVCYFASLHFSKSILFNFDILQYMGVKNTFIW